MRVALVALLLVHGLIHLLGFVRGFALGQVGLTVPVSRAAGAAWLVACVLLVAVAALVALRVAGWWWIAAAAVLLSQALVVSAWSDAKAGTAANLVLAVAALLSWADARFESEGAAQLVALLAPVPVEPPRVVTAADLAPLPDPVRRWLVRAGVAGKPRARVVALTQRGGLRTAPAQRFMDATATQVFTVDEPGFVWRVRTRLFGVVPIAGRDSYVDGHGRMRIAALSLLPLVDASGPRLDQGTLLRWLGEIVWFPSAALSPAITWTPIDTRRARATLHHRGLSVSAEFSFDDDGRFTALRARRWMGAGPDASLEDWYVPAHAWRVVRGVEIPVSGDVVWRLPAGEFNYYRWEIVDVLTDDAALRAVL